MRHIGPWAKKGKSSTLRQRGRAVGQRGSIRSCFRHRHSPYSGAPTAPCARSGGTSSPEAGAGAHEVESLRLQLHDALGRLRLLAAHTRGIVFELDSNARFVRVWTSDPNLLACPHDELLGLTVVEALGPELGRQHHDAALRTLEQGQACRYEYWLDVPSGKRHFSCESVSIPSPSGCGRHVVFWIRDTTERVLLQRDLLEAERLASLGMLAAGVAHEINNPLAYMLLNVEQLRRALSEELSRENATANLASLVARSEMIHEGILRVQRIVQDLLQLSRPGVPLETVRVEPALYEALELVKSKHSSNPSQSVADPAAPQIVVRCSPGLCVVAHHGRLVQVLVNLLENAIAALSASTQPQACEEPPILVEAYREERRVFICVRDQGCGLGAATASQIFSPFFTTKPEGTGLGLAICQRLIASFRGEISALPNAPRGTTLRVALPVPPHVAK